MNVRDAAFFDLSRFTADELVAAAERSRPAVERANREDGGLLALQMAEAEVTPARRLTVRDPGFFDLSRFTPEELLAAMEEARPALDEADRIAGGLFALQQLEDDLDEAGVIDLEAGDELVFDSEANGYIVVRNAR